VVDEDRCHADGGSGRDGPVAPATVVGVEEECLVGSDALEASTDAIAESDGFLHAASQVRKLLQGR
jgi:hypothetical protein